MKKLIAALVFGSCAFAATSLLADYGYYDDGHLLAHWDAIDNQGTGAHVDGAETWVDLKTGGEFVLNGATWGDRFLRFAGANTSYAKLTDETVLGLLAFTEDGTNRTVEVAYRYTTTANSGGQGLLFQGQSGTGIGIGRWYTGTTSTYHILGHGSGTLTMPTPRDTDFHTVAVGYLKTKPSTAADTCFEDGEPRTLSGSNYWGDNDAAMYLGRGKTQYAAAAEIYSVRIYDRLLTPEEAAQNRLADKDRFWRTKVGTVVSGSVTVLGKTFAAGEDFTSFLGEPILTVAAAEDAIVTLDESITGLSLEAGTLALSAEAMREFESLSLGAGAVFRLPAHGLTVSGAITADWTATVKGPGLLVGVAETCPATLSDGAVYACTSGAWTGWPDSGVAYVPADTVADITAGDVAKVANLDGIVLLADSTKVTYGLAADFTLTTPVAGKGTFSFADAGKVVILADNRDLLGAFYFTNTTCVVSNEFGLGSSRARMCHFWCGDTTTATPYGHTLDFDNGETVFTNRVAIHLHPLATKSITFGAISSDKTLVQDADFYFSRYNTNQDYMYPAFRGTVKFLRHFEYVVGTWTQYPYSSVTGGDGVWIMGDFRLKSTGLWLPQKGPYHLGWSSIDSTVSLSPYSTAEIVCEAENILGGMSFQPYQVNSLFDLNGHDQNSDHLGNYNNGSVTTGNPLLRITSATPAAFRITGTDSKNINVLFSGAAGFTMAGTGTYGLYDADSETTGELKVEKGTLKLCDNYAWRGTNVTVTGGALVLESARAVTVNKTHLVVSGGTLTVKAGATAFVGFATFGGTTLEDGTYTMAQLKAMPGVASFIGADSDDDAFITVLKPDDREWHGWPDEPADVEVPGNMTICVGADETNKVALAKSIDLGAGARVVFTNMPDAVIALAMPISGRGVLAFEDCGTVVITADNSGLEAPGAFSFTRTDVRVANRYGLGAVGTGPCYVYTSKDLGARACSMIFTGEAKTNDVAIVVDHAWTFGYDSADVDFVQNANFTQCGGGTRSHQRCRFKNSIVFTRTVAVNDADEDNKCIRLHFTETASLTRSSGSCPWLFGSSASELVFDAPNPSLPGIVFQFGWHVYLNAPYAFNFGSDGLSCYPGATTFHLDGNDQQVSYIAFNNNDQWEKSSDDPLVFTSEEPATLFMTNNRVDPNSRAPVDSRRTFKLTGAVSLDYGGSRLQRMGRGHNDTTGSLTVRGGRF